jgi:aromatic-L-amino-acid/L-tryptophan decarboxylase
MMRTERVSPDSPLTMPPDEFRRLGHALIDEISDFMAGLPARPVVPNGGVAELRALLGAESPLPAHGSPPGPLLREAASLLFDNSTFNAHPRFFGYITAPPAPIGVLGDLLAAAVNPNVGSWILGPMATEIEAQAVRWIAELIGYAPSCGGLLVSGGNMANFTCFLAARTAMADWDIRAGGLSGQGARPLAVYASAETHTWIQKAADLFGLGTNAVRWIPTDDALRMDTAALRSAIDDDVAAGRLPMMVVGTAGSVSTGAVDPLREIAEVCRARGIWFHIDGAYGGFAAAVPNASPDLDALGLADSVAVDPHKWLYAPLEAGCALVRNADALRNAFAYHPAYYHFGVEALNFVDYGPQNSRGFRALKVWLALRHAGRTGYERMIGDDIALSRRLFDAVSVHPELEAVTQGLSITTFRYVPAELRNRIGEPEVEERLNRLNGELLDRLQKGGAAFVSNAVIRGRYVLRACIVNFNTTASDIDALPGIIVEAARMMGAPAAMGGNSG